MTALASTSSDAVTLLGTDNEERLLVNHWLDFACTCVVEDLQRDVEGRVFLPLHTELARKTFLAGGVAPSIADWILFAMLFGRVKAMTPLMAAKYFRLIRWTSYLQSLLLRQPNTNDVDEKKSDGDLNAFVPAVFNMNQIMIALNKETFSINGRAEKSDKLDPLKAMEMKKEKKARQSAASKVDRSTLHPLARVDLRVGKIGSVEKHPQADRLYIEKVDFGEDEQRTVVSGLVEHVPLAELEQRLCVFICNLKPASICKVTSSAMLLVAKQENGNVLEPLIPPSGSKAGDRICIEGVTPAPDEVIKPKENTWEDVRVNMATIEGVACYDGKPLSVIGNAGRITSAKVPTGIIS